MDRLDKEKKNLKSLICFLGETNVYTVINAKQSYIYVGHSIHSKFTHSPIPFAWSQGYISDPIIVYVCCLLSHRTTV